MSYLLTSYYGSSTRTILDAFKDLRDALRDRESEANEAIDNWSGSFMREIGEHARRQKSLVSQAYNTYQEHLQTMCEQYLELNRIYENRKDAEETRRLLEKCRALRVELVNLNFPSVNKEFIEVTMIEPSEQMEEEKARSDQTENDRLKSRKVGENEAGSAYNRATDFSTHSKPTSTSSTTTNQSSTSQSAYDYDRSTSATNDKSSKIDANETDNSIEKCPICYMIFPRVCPQLLAHCMWMSISMMNEEEQ